MTASRELIEEKIKEIDLNKNNPIEQHDDSIKNDEKKAEEGRFLTVKDSYLVDCLTQLNGNETDADKIANATHQFLLALAIKNANKFLKECTEEGKVLIDKKMKGKRNFLIDVCYNESLKMVKDKLFE